MKEKVRQRLSDMEKATAAYQRAKAACDAYLQEGKSDIRVREAEIKRARDEASRLDDSGCPVPETATCKFLSSAVDCKQMLPGMIESWRTPKRSTASATTSSRLPSIRPRRPLTKSEILLMSCPSWSTGSRSFALPHPRRRR